MPTVIERARRFVEFLVPSASPSVGAWSREASKARDYSTLLFGKIKPNGDKLLNQKGGGDLDLWRSLLDDDQAFSTYQQRRLAVINRPWTVEPGGDRRIDIKAADFIRTQLDNIGWDQVCSKMLFATWYGYGVGEAMYGYDPTLNLITLTDIVVPDRAWFGFDADNQLKLRAAFGLQSIDLPENKFWVVRSGADHDFQPYGIGLAHWCYWPIFFKRSTLPFWLRFLEKFGSPTVLGKATGGQLDDVEQKKKVMAALAAVASESQVAVPDWMAVELLQVGGGGADSYDRMLKRMESAITRVILSQTMTTEAGPAGLGSNQASVHADVRDDVVKSDSDLLHESFNRSIVRWLIDWNFPGAAHPTVYRQMEDEEDVDTIADRDTKLKALGWVRTEESFKEIYGDGYEKAAPVVPNPLDPNADPNNPRGQVKPDAPAFSAQDEDDIDRLVALMAADSDEMVKAFVAPLISRLEGVTNPEIARVVMLEWLDRVPAKQWGEFMAKAGIAVRGAVEAGIPTGAVS